MKVIRARNVQAALPKAVRLLNEFGYERESRNGKVVLAPWPVVTEYACPWERVIFWPQRDANPFFHLYESLWMLGGRNDIAPLVSYAANMARFTDDGITQPGAYGYRWRHYRRDNLATYVPTIVEDKGIDQLKLITQRLKDARDDRRSVLQMWNPVLDLNAPSADVPCNLTATFQIDRDGRLEMTVFCRSNDIIWGAYGANAVHFSMLQEYMAHAIGVPIGCYRQISVNWHAYVSNFETVQHLDMIEPNPYRAGLVKHLALCSHEKEPGVDSHLSIIDYDLKRLLYHVDTNFRYYPREDPVEPFFAMAAEVLLAHKMFKALEPPDKYTEPIQLLKISEFKDVDWVVAAREWLERRWVKHGNKVKSSVL